MKHTIFAAVLCFISGFNSTFAADGFIDLGVGNTIELGTGINSLTQEDLDRCVKNDAPTPSGGADAAHTEFDLIEIATQEDLREVLSVDASASLGIGRFGASAEVHYYNDQSLDRRSYMLAVNVDIENESEMLTDYYLTDRAKALLTNPKAFFQACGDSFVASQVTGGKFVAVMRMSSDSSEALQTLKSNFKAKMGLAYQGNVDATKEVSQMFFQNNGEIHIVRYGTRDEIPNITDPQGLVDYARKFSTELSSTSGKAWAFRVKLKPYSAIMDAQMPGAVSITQSKLVVEDLAQSHDQALQLYHEIVDVLTHPNNYGAFDQKQMEQAEDAALVVVDRLRAQAMQCELTPDDLNLCKRLTAEETQLPNISLPTIAAKPVVYKLGRTAACGVESYELGDLPLTCRTPSNGVETTNTVPTPYEGEGTSCEDLAKSNWPAWFKTGASPRAGQITTTGFTRGSFCHGGPMGGCDEPTPSTVRCQIDVITDTYRLAPNAACGTVRGPDLNHPIYKECRDPSNGVEGNS